MARVAAAPPLAFTSRSNHDRMGGMAGEKKEIWSTLLDNVSSGKRVPEKNLVVLGGTQESQKDFIESLARTPPPTRRIRGQDRTRAKQPQIANQFALGYTYQDVYDADHEDLLARMSVSTLNDPSPAYAPLLAHILKPAAIPHTAVAILLDWNEPWNFITTLLAWIRLLNMATTSLPAEASSALEENDSTWRRMRNKADEPALPLEEGLFDEPLGLPLLVVCQNALAIEKLERERGYRESHFDFILQVLRTVLLKHGAGLIYTMPGQSAALQPLLHYMLNIQSGLLSGGMLGSNSSDHAPKHNVVDREGVLVPPGWDSWGKIKILKENLDTQGISRAWSVDIQSDDSVGDHDSTTAMYAHEIQDPRPPRDSTPRIEIESTPDQTFLAAQLEILEKYRADDEAAKKQREARRLGGTATPDRNGSHGSSNSGSMVHEQIGPVQFNMGGIDYDAEEAVRQLKERTETPHPSTRRTGRATRDSTPFSPLNPGTSASSAASSPTPFASEDPEELAKYFASLMKGGGGGIGGRSVTSSPRLGRDSPRGSRESGAGAG